MTTSDNSKPETLNSKQMLLLAAAEESYSQASGVLQPVLKELVDCMEYAPVPTEQIRTGLHLLEEAMAAHNRYMDSLK